MAKLRAAIVGVGNCATSLIQGVEFYKDAKDGDTVPGLMHVQLGDYHISDIEFVAAFDVDSLKVGKELVEATQASENNTIKICDVPKTRHPGAAWSHPRRPRQVLPRDHRRVRRRPRGHRQGPQGHRSRRADLLPARRLRRRRQVLRAVRDRRQRGVRQRAARVHRLGPRVGQEVRGRWRAHRRRRHQVPGGRHHHAPRAGSPVRGPRRAAWTAPTSSTLVETWTSRTCWSASASSPRRSPRPRP